MTEEPERELTIAMIAARAEVPPSTIYRRWGTLQKLLEDVTSKRFLPDSVPRNTGSFPAPAIRSFEETLVDEALRATREHSSWPAASNSPLEEISALRAEMKRLRESAMEIGAASVRISQAEASDLASWTRTRIRKHPCAAIGLAAFLGYVCGLTR